MLRKGLMWVNLRVVAARHNLCFSSKDKRTTPRISPHE
jgi:hypothetical protein